MSKNDSFIQVGDLLYDETFDRIGWVVEVRSFDNYVNEWSDGNTSWNSYITTESYKDNFFILDRRLLRESRK